MKLLDKMFGPANEAESVDEETWSVPEEPAVSKEAAFEEIAPPESTRLDEETETNSGKEAEDEFDVICMDELTQKLDFIAQALSKQEADISAFHDALSNHDNISEALNKALETNKRLSSRIREYEDNLIQERVVNPTLERLVSLYRSISREQKSFTDTRILDFLKSIQGEILEALKSHDVIPMDDLGASFDPKRQRVVRVEYIEMPEDNAVTQTINEGFYKVTNDGLSVFKMAEIVVAKHKK